MMLLHADTSLFSNIIAKFADFAYIYRHVCTFNVIHHTHKGYIIARYTKNVFLRREHQLRLLVIVFSAFVPFVKIEDLPTL